MADDNYEEVAAQARALQTQREQDARQSLGSMKVADEQDGYQQTIDQQRASANPPGLLSRVATGAKDIVVHPVDDLKAAWNGVAQGAGQLSVTADSLFAHIPGYSKAMDALTGTTQDQFKKAINSGEGAIGSVDMTATNKENSGAAFVQSITQFLTGRAAITAATGGAGALANVGSMVAAFNPDDKHLTDALAQVPGLSDKYKAILETKPGDSELENRFKSLLDGVTFEAGAKVAGALVSWVRGAYAAKQLAEDTSKSARLDPTPVTPTAEGAPVASPTADRAQFLKEFNALPDHETQVGHKAVGKASVDIASDPVRDDTVHLETIRADETNKGYGTAALKTLTDMADKHGVRVTLDAAPMDGSGISGDKLVDLYKDHGFTPSDAEARAGVAMSREPAAPKPWVPEDLKAQETAHPASTVDQPKPGSAPAAVFNPNTIAATMSIPKAAAADVLKAISEGRFSDVPNMLDDTHRTIPWEQLSDGANLKGVLNAVEDKLGTVIKAAHGTGQVSADSIRQLAADIGGDRASLAKLYGDTTAQGGLAARITAGYNMLMASAKQLRDLAGVAGKEGASNESILAFQKQLALHSAITGEVRQSSSEIGRALYAHRALKASTDVALQNINDYASTQLGPKALQNLAKQVANAGDLKSITNVADQVRAKGWKGVLQEVANNGMLSGPKTQITNAVGNLFNVGLKIGERYIAGGIGDVRKVLFGTEDTASLREAVAYSKGAGAGLSTAWKLAWAAIKDENYGAALTNKALETGSAEDRALAEKAAKFGNVPSQAIRMDTAGTSGLDFTYRQAINAIGTAVRWPGRLMGLFDHFSQGVGYHGDLNAQAYKAAAAEADERGLQGTARDSYLDQRQGELMAKPTSEMDQHAMGAGRYTAFLEPPQTKFGKGVYQALNNTDPLIKLVVAPFIHRPGNILRQAVGDYTIAGRALPNVKAALAAGGSDADLAMARMTIGTSVFLGGLGLASNGMIVGQRLGAKNTESLDAVPQYSINLGGRWFKFDRLDPVGMWLGLAADAHEAYAHHYDPNDPDSTDALTKASSAAVLALTHSTLDKSFMKSVQDIMQASSEKPERAGEMAQKLVEDNIAKLVPFSGLLRTIEQATDGTQRASGRGSLFDGAVAEIPYLAQDLPPRRDLLGRPMPVVSAWNPFLSTKGNTDPMDQELSKVAMSINAPSRTIDGYQLNSHEYDTVITNATQAKVFPGGSTIEEYLRDVTSSPQWKLNQDQSDHGQYLNGLIVQKALDAAYLYGTDQYKSDHPDLAMRKADEQQARFKAAITPLMQFDSK